MSKSDQSLSQAQGAEQEIHLHFIQLLNYIQQILLVSYPLEYFNEYMKLDCDVSTISQHCLNLNVSMMSSCGDSEQCCYG